MIRQVRSLPTNTRGGLTIVFAMVLVVLTLFIGLAIDLSAVRSAKMRLDMLADDAALAGVVEARSKLLNNGMNNSGQVSKAVKSGQKSALAFFNTKTAKDFDLTSLAASPQVTVTGQVATAVVTYTASYRPHFLGAMGINRIPISSSATATVSVVPYIEVTMMVDTSGSMAIGADSAAQDKLQSLTGCAFACHDGNKFGGYPDVYAYALAQGITLRYQAINSGLNKLIGEFDTLDPDQKYIGGEIWSFDTNSKKLQQMTTNRSRLRAAMPAAPATSTEYDGATHFNEAIGDVVRSIGKGGDGSNPGHPIKLLIIATDGAQDPGRFWTWNLPYRDQVGPFDMTFCSALKQNNVQVGIVHTPYLPMSYDWGYNATLGQPSVIGGSGTRADDITAVFKACAGSLYVNAASSSEIVQGFVNIMQQAITPRLTH